MLDRDDYARGWAWKKEWYTQNGFHLGKNLYTTEEGPGLDMSQVARVAESVGKAIRGR